MYAKSLNLTLFAVLIAVLASVRALEPALRSAKDYSHGNEKISERVAGGVETAPNEAPWQVYVKSYLRSGGMVVCGGSLLSDEWILSAASCTYGIANMTVILGAHDLSDTSDDAYRQTFTIPLGNIKLYPDWYYGKLDGDLVLIQLPFKASINNYVRPISLPYSDDSSFEGEYVVLTGWGYSDGQSDMSATLQKTTTSVLPSVGADPACQVESGLVFDGAKIICGDGKSSKRTCYGDDGSPMNYFRMNEGNWVVVGVATSSDTSTECATSTKPSLYNRVSYYLSWIHDTTGIPPNIRPGATTTNNQPSPTTLQTESAIDSLCEGSPDGLYGIPGETCTKFFIECRDGIAYLKDCPEIATVFDVSRGLCDYPFNVPGCPSYTSSPILYWLINKRN